MPRMKSPNRMGHVVLKTYDVPRLRDWYCTVLGARTVFESLPNNCFITYDDEHHRLAFAKQSGPPIAADPRAPGMHHVAFYFDSVRDLLNNYSALAEQGIEPVFAVNHGPSLSFYYSDPDGNGIEFGVDRYETAAEHQKFIDENFNRNPVGVSVNPDALVAKMKAGASDEELLAYDYKAPMADLPYDELKGAVGQES